MIIALAGFAGAGKDTVANFLVERYQFERHAFADPLKAMLYALNPVVLFDEKKRVADLVDESHWDAAKQIPEVRELLQRLGTEAARENLGYDIWTRTLFSKYGGVKDLVIPDLRYTNEANAVLDHGGFCVCIQRRRTGPVNEHGSETSLIGWRFDSYIQNDSSLGDLRVKTDDLFRQLRILEKDYELVASSPFAPETEQSGTDHS